MILDHCGLPEIRAFLPPARRQDFEAGTKAEDWKRGIDAVAKCENTICKISGIIAGVTEGWRPEDLAPIINHCFDAFGPDRVVFGSDWPVCLKGASLKQWVETLRTVTADRSAENRRKLWSENAIRHYSLKA
jgi:L-fuconolactonase